MSTTLCIAGKNNIAVEVLKFCICKYEKMNIVAVLTRGDSGVNGWQQSLKFFCEQNGISIITLEDAYSINNLIFLSLEFDRIINPILFSTDKLFNLHYSLLPKYKGMYPSVMPILNNESKTGVTLHKIRQGIDTGEIIAQKSVDICCKDTSFDIYNYLTQLGIELVTGYVDKLIHGSYNYVSQEPLFSTYFSSDAIDYDNLVLNTRCTAYQIQSQVRAFAFRPYQLLEYKGSRIIEALITSDVSNKKAGTVLEETDILFRVSTIDYDIVLFKDVLHQLLKAIEQHNNSYAKYLCVSDKIINAQNSYGWSPLCVAVYNNNMEMVLYLFERGADINVVNYNGTNLLMYAKEVYKRTKNNEMFNYIYDKGISEYKKDYSGKDLLYYIERDGITMKELTENDN